MTSTDSTTVAPVGILDEDEKPVYIVSHVVQLTKYGYQEYHSQVCLTVEEVNDLVDELKTNPDMKHIWVYRSFLVDHFEIQKTKH